MQVDNGIFTVPISFYATIAFIRSVSQLIFADGALVKEVRFIDLVEVLLVNMGEHVLMLPVNAAIVEVAALKFAVDILLLIIFAKYASIVKSLVNE